MKLVTDGGVITLLVFIVIDNLYLVLPESRSVRQPLRAGAIHIFHSWSCRRIRLEIFQQCIIPREATFALLVVLNLLHLVVLVRHV